MLKKLETKILKKKTKVGIIGLGYVGLPLAVIFAKRGFKTFGIDIDKDRVERLRKGESYILDVPTSDLAKAKKGKWLTVTTDFSVIKKLDAVIICVPTPLNKTKEPDVSYIVSAVENIKRYMKRGQIVVLESTTYPGTTEEVMMPVLESSDFKEGRDFYLAFSPERIDPGNRQFKTENTRHVIGIDLYSGETLWTGHRKGDPGLVEQGRGDGQASGEYLQDCQYRPRQRDNAHVRQARHKCLGGHRGGEDETIRLHAFLSRPGGGRPLPRKGRTRFCKRQR
jgi:hypothetical protein